MSNDQVELEKDAEMRRPVFKIGRTNVRVRCLFQNSVVFDDPGRDLKTVHELYTHIREGFGNIREL